MDDLIFDDDQLVIPFKKKYSPKNRGGSGLLRVYFILVIVDINE